MPQMLSIEIECKTIWMENRKKAQSIHFKRNEIERKSVQLENVENWISNVYIETQQEV